MENVFHDDGSREGEIVMGKLDWKIVESEYLVQNRWITLRADKCEMPNGRIIDDYYILEQKDWVNVVPVTPNGEIVMIRLYRHGIQETIWEVPGGMVDVAGESPLATAVRELQEETGYVSEQFVLLGTGAPDPARYTNTVHYYLARDAHFVGGQAWDEGEEFEVILVPIAEVVQMLLRGDCKNAEQQAALFYALLAMGEMGIGD